MTSEAGPTPAPPALHATSVPQVRPIAHIKRELAELLELARNYGRESGDWTVFARTVSLARAIFEQHIKPAAHRGNLPWPYVDQVGAALDRVEAIAAQRASAPKALSTGGEA